MKLKKTRETLNLLCIVFAFCALLGWLSEGTFWMIVTLSLALVILYVAFKFLRCPHCGKRVHLASDKFCPHCGKESSDE